MDRYITQEQAGRYEQFLHFAKQNVVQRASSWEKEEAIPRAIIEACAAAGYLGATIPQEYGGMGWDIVTYGLLNEAIGGASVSLTGLLNVHTMVAQTLLKWGSDEQKQRWLPALASGQLVSVFALTEPGAGSDIQALTTRYSRSHDDFLIKGTKKWITFAGAADLFLIFGKLDDAPVAALIERDTPGLRVVPIRGMLGFKAAHLARLELNDCRIPSRNLIGKPGFALTCIAPYALDYGRISVALAALGLLRASLEISGRYSLGRESFGSRLIDHGTISAMIADMGVDLEAARLLCIEACRAKDAGLADAAEKIMIAKYFTCKSAAHHVAHAVQILGALGCNEDFPLARFYRDAKTMEIIEGSNQIHQFLLGKSFARKQKNRKTTQAVTSNE
ncbi:MAG TPA: acyl-CoA dehydrogenase family protein [Ktedonobacteraceae bacterium]|nr:acyl-CoA dehydrogenase family protein [Ktedonobacteraceae bacterium]